MKKNMVLYNNSGHDVTTPKEMKLAITAFTGVKGTSVAVLTVNHDRAEEMKTAKKIPWVTKMFQFSYIKRDDSWSVLCRRYWNIGTGSSVDLGCLRPSQFDPTVSSDYCEGNSVQPTSSLGRQKHRQGILHSFPCDHQD